MCYIRQKKELQQWNFSYLKLSITIKNFKCYPEATKSSSMDTEDGDIQGTPSFKLSVVFSPSPVCCRCLVKMLVASKNDVVTKINIPVDSTDCITRQENGLAC